MLVRRRARSTCSTHLAVAYTAIVIFALVAFWRTTRNDPFSHFIENTTVVLFWNGIHDLPEGWFEVPGYTFIGAKGIRTCPLAPHPGAAEAGYPHKTAECYFTTDKSLLRRADAVVVSGQHDNPLDNTALPQYRHPNQIYVFYSSEAPSHKWRDETRYGDWLSVFNWTATYRRDSDIWQPYGDFEEIPEYSAPNGEEAFTRSVEAIKWKNSTAAAIMSYCPNKLLRETLIRQLQEAGLEIDIYGKCGNTENICPKQWIHDCYPVLARKHRFFLAFENSACHDYVTEKLYGALKNPWIPIVFGGANYAQLAPPKSVIEVTSLDEHGEPLQPAFAGSDLTQHHGEKLTPSQLVKLVNVLEQDQTLYSSYFQWKRKYRAFRVYDHGCSLCTELAKWKHSAKKVRRTYPNMQQWWEPRNVCM